MAAEIIEDYDWESDESEDWESDEALAESDESTEDIGERARRRRRQRRYYRPGRGVQGITVRGQDGRARNLSFPTKLATAAETNRGLASQEMARRALAQRLDRLEARSRKLLKNDSSISGLVTLAIAGSLTTFGAIKASEKSVGFRGWAAEPSTRTAAVISATQLATSGAKLVINGRYHRSGIGIAADIFSAAQLGAFTFASLSTPPVKPAPKSVADIAAVNAGTFTAGDFVIDTTTHQVFEVIVDAGGVSQFALVSD